MKLDDPYERIFNLKLWETYSEQELLAINSKIDIVESNKQIIAEQHGYDYEEEQKHMKESRLKLIASFAETTDLLQSKEESKEEKPLHRFSRMVTIKEKEN